MWAPASICSSACAWISTPGTEGSSGVALRSRSPVALDPIRMWRPATSLGVEGAVEDRVRGEITARVRGGEVEPHLPVGVGREHGFADPHRLDAAPLAERRHAAAPRRAHEERRFFRSHPQRLDGERGIERVGDGHEEGDAAHDLIVGREPVHRALASRRGGEHRQAADGARKFRHEQLGIVAGDGKSGLRGGGRLVARLVGRDAEDGRDLGKGGGEDLIVGGERLERAERGSELRAARDLPRDFRRREAIGLGQDEVEGDRLGAGLGELLDDRREMAARPRPLADACEGGFVDVDDAHGEGGIGFARGELQVAVEDRKAEARDGVGVGDAQRNCQDEQGCGEQRLDRRSAHVRVPSRRRRTSPVACGRA